MRKIIIILDGVADIPPKTSLSLAKTPTLDFLAKHSKCGLMHPIKGIAPESGEAQFIILGQSLKDFPGRGPLEALGSNIKLKPNQIALRANFAEIKNNKLTKRRTSPPSKQQIKLLNNIHKDIKVYQTIKHRAILTVKNASPNITNTDPGYKKIKNYSQAIEVKLKKLKVTGNKATAKKLNSFIKQAEKILKNKTILLRGAGKQPKKLTPLKNWSMIADMPVEYGLAKLLGMKRLKRKNIIKQLLKSKSNIYLQIKGPDTPGHHGNLKEKIKQIEKIDKFLTPIKNIKNTIIAITADHATPYQLKRHSKHPVPYLIYNSNKPIKSKIKNFTESECKKGKTIQGKDLLKLIS